jgi:hypothetical protein
LDRCVCLNVLQPLRPERGTAQLHTNNWTPNSSCQQPHPSNTILVAGICAHLGIAWRYLRRVLQIIHIYVNPPVDVTTAKLFQEVPFEGLLAGYPRESSHSSGTAHRSGGGGWRSNHALDAGTFPALLLQFLIQDNIATSQCRTRMGRHVPENLVSQYSAT